jgi:CheY-like chemotaxis protein
MPDHRAFPHGPGTQSLDALPLQGLTLLAVEDSRFAADALRLMARRSGARLRRAGSIRDARGHLGVYRPDLVLIDLGLPDGDGADLIRELATTGLQRRPLAMSGDPGRREAARAAGALGFLEKPIPDLRSFQRVLLAALGLPLGDGRNPDAAPPDALALYDDLRQAAVWLAHPAVRGNPAYLAGFVAGLARQSGDTEMLMSANALTARAEDLDRLGSLIARRISAARSAYVTIRG